MITLVDYGLGNIQAFANIYRHLNIPTVVAKDADELSVAEKIILPGVGAFDWAVARLNESGMRDCLHDLVLVQRRPVLGICVGMQIMARSSEEGELAGLGWLDAEVNRFDNSISSQDAPLPHMGWNDVVPRQEESLLAGIDGDARFYFLHSYYLTAGRPSDVLAVTDYNGPFTCAVRSGNIFGVQFHPEKSHTWGIQLLKNFAEL